MATYKILEIGSNSALVEIDFGTPLFNDYDAKEKPVRVSTQRFKVDDLTTDDVETLTSAIESFVSQKVLDLKPTEIPVGVQNLIGDVQELLVV